MSYPEPLYHAETGVINASFRPATQEPDVRYPSGGSADFLATGGSTGGRFGLYRWNMPAEPGGTSPHFHRTMSESFYVVSGTVRLYDGRDWVDAQTGDFLHVPEGGIHSFRNESGAPASMLILFAPGAPREEYFRTVARIAEGLVMTPEERAAFFLRHDTYSA